MLSHAAVLLVSISTSASLTVLPISFGTFLILAYYSATKKQILASYKMLLLLLVMIYCNTMSALSNPYLVYYIEIPQNKSMHRWRVTEFMANAYILQPLTTWLFSWQYFDSVTSLLDAKMHQALAWLLKVFYVVGSLATIGSYCSTSILQADLLYYLNNLMFTEATQYTDMEINSKNASAYINMILSVSSVCLMLATVYQMTRFVK